MLNMLKSLNIISPVWNDAPEPWQWTFQDGASPSYEGIVELHDQIMFYLVVILFGVSWALTSIIVNFGSNKNKIAYKYHNHGQECHFIKNYNMLKLGARITHGPYNTSRNYTTQNSNEIDNIVDSKVNLKNNKSIILLINNTSTLEQGVNKTYFSIPLVETKGTKDGKIVLNNMLSYLKSLKNNKVLEFLTDNVQVQNLMKDNPIVNVNGINNSLAATHCMPANLSFKYKDLKSKSGVYLFIHPESGMCYIGSAVSFHQRLKNHRAVVKKSIRHDSPLVSEFYSNVTNLGGFQNMV